VCLTAVALVTASCSSPAPSASSHPPASSSTTESTAAPVPSSPTVWLCKPGAAGDPCELSSLATSVSADGSRSAAAAQASPDASRFDCFYVYPTVSTEDAANTGLTVGKAEIAVAAVQASPFSQVCNVWAPMYKSETTKSVGEGLDGTPTGTAILHSTFTVAYESLLSAWEDFVAHDDNGLPIILIGDSQGSAILIHLISTKLDEEPSLLSRVVVAIVPGGNLQVPTGKTVGATFSRMPLCTSTTETGCAIAWSSFPSEPPADTLFGRPGQGVSIQSYQTSIAGQQVACVNPAALDGGSADLSPYFLSVTEKGLKPAARTPWVTFPDLYSAHCESTGGATWLQVTDIATSGDTRPVVSVTPNAQWGYHANDVNLALGDLLRDVADEESAWSASHP
jgi:Protein of unknown function (DUF3089)